MKSTIRKIVVGGRTWTYVVDKCTVFMIRCPELQIKYDDTSHYNEKYWKGSQQIRPSMIRSSIEEYCKKRNIKPIEVAKKEPERV